MNYKICSFTNFKYIEMAKFWGSHMDAIDLDYLIFCTDTESFEFLSKKNIKCALYQYDQEGDREVKVRSHGYVNSLKGEFGLVRFRIISHLLESYQNVIFSDLDAIWLDNPLPEILDSGYDASFSTVHHDSAYPSYIRKRWGVTICVGWMHFNHTCKKLVEDFIDEYYQLKGYDQEKFNRFLHSINNVIDKNISDHSFILELPRYELKTLGLNRYLIHRGGYVDGCKVIHPLTGMGHKNKMQRLLRHLKKYEKI